MASDNSISRRTFLKQSAGGLALSLLYPLGLDAAGTFTNDVFRVVSIPEDPFLDASSPNSHAGIDGLLNVMAQKGLKFYRSTLDQVLSGPSGMISADDIVLIKVNAQWKYRGCTNSDLIRGLIQSILDHPDGFTGEVVIIENGQGRGSLECNTSASYGGDTSVQANANDPSHSFVCLVDHIFSDDRVSYYLLDRIRKKFIRSKDNTTDGYRKLENVSYPCFTTKGGRRVDMRKGILTAGVYEQNLKLINVPVLKDHGGSQFTASLKHFYGILSMSDGHSPERHFTNLGKTCGKMVVSVRPPVLNIIDATWVSYSSLAGYPVDTTFRANTIMASQDPVALDYCAARDILYPIDRNPKHNPDHRVIRKWMDAAAKLINKRGGIYNPESGIKVGEVTRNESQIAITEVTSAQV
jgi:hypothetical protein